MSKIVPADLHGVIDDGNSSTTPLTAASTFTGEWMDITEWGIIYVSVYSDVAGATDGLVIEQSLDMVNSDHTDVFTVPATTGKNFSINPHSQFMRIVYTNGGTNQSEFRLQCKLNTTGLASAHRIADPIVSDDDATLVKAVLTGQDPFGDFINFQATRLGNFRVAIEEYGDTPTIGAFGRQRTSSPYTLFDSKQLYDKQPLFYDESIGGSATSTHSTTNANVAMAVTASASDFVIRQTKMRFNYQPGKSLIAFWTFHAPLETGVTKRMGIFDGTGANFLTPNNGIYLAVTGTTVSWNIAKNGSTTETVTQSNWNYDPMDGTGPSGITLDMDATQIAVTDLEYLGVGRVRCGFIIDGLYRYVHYFNHANDSTFTTPYMSTPNLPIRYDIQSDGSGAGDLDHICSTIMSEGGQQLTGVSRSIDTDGTHLDANTANTPYVMLAIRLKTTHLDLTVLPEYISMISETNDDFRWSLHLNPTYNGTLTYGDIANSGVQFAAGATANDITAAGVKIDSGYAKQNASIDRRITTALRLGSQIDGTRDEMILAATPLGNNSDMQGSLTFRELL